MSAAQLRAGDAPIIEAIDVRVYVVPTDAPEADGTTSWDSTTMVLVRALADSVVGTGWTYGAAECADVAKRILCPVVLHESALDLAERFDDMVVAVRNEGRQGAIGYAISAVDAALWDLKARLLRLPLFRLMGAVRTEVPVYGSGGFTSYTDEQQARQLDGWVHGQGIPRVKIKIGEDWGGNVERDLERIRKARRTIGDDAELFVDANGAYSRKEAVRVAGRAGDDRPSWFEEPVTSDDLEGLREVRDAIDADVAAGEYGFDLPYFRRMCEAGAVDCLQVDATRCGGFSEFQRAAATAASFSLDVSAHCAPNLHAHVAAAIPNLRHIEWFHDHARIEELFFEGALDPAGGIVRPDPAFAGNGLVLRERDVAEYRVA